MSTSIDIASVMDSGENEDGLGATNDFTALKVVHKPLVISDSGGLYSVTVDDNIKSDAHDDSIVSKLGKELTEDSAENKVLDGDGEQENGAESMDDKGSQTTKKKGKDNPKKKIEVAADSEKPAGTKGKRGRKPKAKVEGADTEAQGDSTAKPKGKPGRKRKDTADASNGGDKADAEDAVKPKRARKSAKKSSLSTLELSMPPTPPASPPPLTAEELASRAAEAAAEEARQTRLKAIPYYREEMKEIFDYLCDRNVYWRQDLPRNKRYSNRDTKLLEKEVRKKFAEILQGYPLESEVMEAFENEEKRRLRAVTEVADGEKVENDVNGDETAALDG
ncbi:hypothetical protein TWF696_001704 [Orbilia brochopaga]|uniref:Uncharacterized protein n=1 Tax=Orbilia brochopaga TaxID=3140254 RepID=A0AAV9UA02_9PEZI